MEGKHQENRLGIEKVTSLLFKLSVPAIISMFIQALYSVIDSIWVARISSEALAALQIAFPVQLILIAIAVGTGIGTSSLISRLLGEGKDKKASSVAEHVILLSIFYGLVVALLGAVFSENIIKLFTDDILLIDYATRYIRIILIGSIAMFIPMIANNILRGEGNTLIPMIAMLIGSIINIILDPLLIFGIGPFPELGIEGAAIATVIARILSGIFILIMLFFGNNNIKLSFKTFKYDFNIIKNVYAVGVPAMIMQFLASFMMIGLNKILDGYGSDAIAAMGIYFRLQTFVFMPVFGLAQGYIPIIGYNYGHNNPVRVKETINIGFIVAFSFTTLGFIIFQIFSAQLILIFDDSPNLVNIGTKALRLISFAFPIIGPAIIGSTTFQALGKGIPSLILSFSRQIILLLPLAYIFSMLYGLNAIWYSFLISEAVVGVVLFVWLRSTLKDVFLKMQVGK